VKNIGLSLLQYLHLEDEQFDFVVKPYFTL
jgi:hypothetical protein